ncbi:MAG: CoA-binding protein [Deltaproteobacteria bacterium]|nr:CoA-binding protein [Deltaproteobacteria bacterium]
MPRDRILNAQSVAVIGVSKIETKRGYQTIRTLLEEGFAGNIHPVNPKEKSILGSETQAIRKLLLLCAEVIESYTVNCQRG